MKADAREVVNLRKAAAAWVAGLAMPVRDSRDSAFVRLDVALQRAAARYATARGPKLPRVPLPRQKGGAHRTRRNEPARKRKHKGKQED